MNPSPEWTTFLQQAGFEVVHWASIGSPTASDADILSWAQERGYVVLTHDLDISAVPAVTVAGATGPTVLQVPTQDFLPGAVGREVVRVLTLRSRPRAAKDELQSEAQAALEPKDFGKFCSNGWDVSFE